MASFQIMDFYTLTGLGFIIVGRVTDGTLRMGMKSNISGKKIIIKTIKLHGAAVRQANAGASVGITVKLDMQDKPLLQRLFMTDKQKFRFLDDYKGKIIGFY